MQKHQQLRRTERQCRPVFYTGAHLSTISQSRYLIMLDIKLTQKIWYSQLRHLYRNNFFGLYPQKCKQKNEWDVKEEENKVLVSYSSLVVYRVRSRQAPTMDDLVILGLFQIPDSRCWCVAAMQDDSCWSRKFFKCMLFLAWVTWSW